MDPVYLDPFPMPRFCYLDCNFKLNIDQHAMLYVTSDKITRYNILDPANPIYISQLQLLFYFRQRLGDYQPNGQAISVAPAGVFVITTTIGGVYGIGQWNGEFLVDIR